jgi:hypothetical protein
MVYKGRVAADTTMPHEPAPAPSADQSRGEPPSNTDDLDPFWKAISLQAEARAARYAGAPERSAKKPEGARLVQLAFDWKSERAFLLLPHSNW